MLDHQHQMVAATFEYPPTWHAESQVVWNFQHHSFPVQLFGRVRHPDGVTGVELFPVEWCCWIEPNLGIHQPGQPLGDGMILLPPMSAPDMMTRWILSKYRRHVEGLTILGVTPLPRLATALGTEIKGAATEGVSVKLAYRENGREIEEELYGLRAEFPGIPTYGAAGMLVQVNWGMVRLFGFRAERSHFDEHREAFWSIIQTTKPNPQWEQVCAQRIEELKQLFEQYLRAGYAQIEAATQLSRQISAQNDAWLNQQAQQREAAYQSEQRRRHDEQQSQGGYTANDAFGDYIMGRETYDDPYWQYGSQHSGYHDYVWTDKQGNYQYSNDANFDPNVNASSNWVLMRKKQIGD